MTNDWYEKYIEEEIRPLVRLLRDNGFNTVSSCGHKMTINCEWTEDGELKRLSDLLYNNKNETYTIVATIDVIKGCTHSSIKINFRKNQKRQKS